MFIEEFIAIVENPYRPQHGRRKMLRLRCDQCDRVFERGFSKGDRDRELHFCDKDCTGLSRRPGRKMQAKMQETWLDHFGVTNPNKSPIVRQKTRATNKERYGNEEIMLSKRFKEGRIETWIKNLGVDNPSKSPIVKQLISERISANFQDPVKAKEILDKRLLTMTKNGTASYFQSALENRLYAILCELFGVENIKRPAILGGFIVDFSVKLPDGALVYVELDGVYWHGLDRPIEEIRMSTKPHDVTRARKFKNDRNQARWFEHRNLRLVRITDAQRICWERDGSARENVSQMVCSSS